MTMATAGLLDRRNERLDEYVQRFGGPPPLLTMDGLSDEEFAERVAAAIDSGEAIADAEFEGDASEQTTVY